ncbi:MAG: permease [Melioribacteraceae bacterium]|nr:MAG: permease [Melioribacteraceae bacterium]
MKLLDRYVVKQFVQIFFFGILAFILIFLIIDMMENLDDFIDKDVPAEIMAQYYLVFLPEMVRLITPVAVLLAALFTVGKMSGQNELAAIKAGGVSLYRFMVPFMVTALIISLGSVYFGGYVVPFANKEKVKIEQEYMNKSIVHAGSNIFFQDSKTRIVTIAYYDVNRYQANRVSIQEFADNDITQMLSRIDASRMVYDTTSGDWILKKATKREFGKQNESIFYYDSLALSHLNFTPEEVYKKQQKPEEMNITELKDLADSQLKSGNDPTRILIEYHTRLAYPFASFVIVLFGIPLSANKRRGGLAVQFIINVLITFIYLVLMNIAQAYGKNGVLDPVLTAWFNNIIFLVVAIGYIFTVRK